MADARLTPAEVLYVDDGDTKRCNRCVMFLPDGDCSIFGEGEKVSGEDGCCGVYVPGKAAPGAKAERLLTRATADYGADKGLGGYSCGSCRWGGGAVCMHPNLVRFRISQRGGCCNAWSGPVPWRDKTGKEKAPGGGK